MADEIDAQKRRGLHYIQNRRAEIEADARRLEELLEAYGSSVPSALIRALAVYILDPRHGFDQMARQQALRALASAARYAGREALAKEWEALV